MNRLTGLRYYHFIAGVLANQQHDPLCRICKAFTNSVQQARQEVDAYMMTNEAELTSLSEQDSIMLADMKMMLADLHPIPDAIGQKKAGNCLLQQGVCFIKSSKSLIDRISS